MQIDQKKYDDLFTIKYKVDKDELDRSWEAYNERARTWGGSRIQFYCSIFEGIVKKFKTELPKDEHYDFIITYFYTSFISALEEDGYPASKYKKALDHFKSSELPATVIQTTEKPVYSEPTYKRYNVNTKYGRRKAREQAHSNYENGSPEYRKSIDEIRIVVWLIIIIIVAIVFAVKQLSSD